MKMKRLSKRLKVASLLLLGSIPFACCLLCCYPWPIKEQTTVGVRKDAQGNVVQEIILENRYKWDIPFPGAHGWTGFFGRNRGAWGYKWFLQEPGKPRRELAFFGLKTAGPFRQSPQSSCWPVDESPLWVWLQRRSPGFPAYVDLVVFNDTEILHRRLLTFENQSLQLEGTHDLYKLVNGNRTVVYRTKEGYEAYDVTTDTVTPWKPPKN